MRKEKLKELCEKDKFSTTGGYRYSNSYVIYYNIPWTIRGIDWTNEELIIFACDVLIHKLARNIQEVQDFIEKHRFDWFKEMTGGRVYKRESLREDIFEIAKIEKSLTKNAFDPFSKYKTQIECKLCGMSWEVKRITGRLKKTNSTVNQEKWWECPNGCNRGVIE